MKSEKNNLANKVSRPNPVRRRRDGRISNALQLHKATLLASLLRLIRTPFATAMAVMVMAIALSLAGSFYVLVSNGQQLVNTLQTGKQISLFLQGEINDQQASTLAREIRAYNEVAKVTIITKQQALAEFKQYSGFGTALDALAGNPLPVVLQIYPKESLTEAYQLKHLLTQMQNLQAVDFAQMDMDWVTRLQSIMEIAIRIVVVLSSLLALAVIFITGNTIRSELQARHDEVVVTKLVGGTNAFICRPFLYAGFWYGFISGVLACVIITILLVVVNTPLKQLTLLYQSQFQMHFMSLGDSALLIIGASLLGIFGAFAVANHQLRLLKPE